MSEDNFYGRRINTGFNSFKIEICEVCIQKSATWVETKGGGGEEYVVRMTCDDCHEEYLTGEAHIGTSVAREATEMDKITENAREGWVDEFINQSDTIESIDVVNITNTETTENEGSWSKEFIDEALFGNDPVGWMDKQGLYEENNWTSTISTLTGFSTNDLSNVRLSAIQCLYELFIKNTVLKDKVKQAISFFDSDENEMVSQFANEMNTKI